jgi:hypothetical protein
VWTVHHLEPRFPAVPLPNGHYESVYLTATHPDQGTALWIRYTVRKPPGSGAVGSVWFTEFRPEGPRAAKASAGVSSTPEHPVSVGEHGSVSTEGAVGAVEAPGCTARWDLTFSGDEAPFEHLPYRWMYSSAVPRTKPTSPRPDLTVSGALQVNGETTVLDGWRGMLGHNWGVEHAHQWIWLRGAGFADDPSVWLDVVLGRIRLGRVLLPWIANGVLSMAGERHVLGGLARRPAVRPRRDGLDLHLAGADLRVGLAVDAPVERCVGWAYADPSGTTHQVRNCSNAGMRLGVDVDGDSRTLATTFGAVYELGGPEAHPGVAVQPFPDR